VGTVGRFGKRLLQGLINFCVNGDFDQVLLLCPQDLRNPGIHMYLAGIYRLALTNKKVTRL